MDKKIKIIIKVIVLFVVVGGAFYGGVLYKGSQSQQRAMGQNARTGARFMGGANFILGDVVARDDQSITVKIRDGSSRIVFYSSTTDVGKFVQGTADDLILGKTVMVNGKTNSDGSVTAQSIQIRPPMPQAPAKNP